MQSAECKVQNGRNRQCGSRLNSAFNIRHSAFTLTEILVVIVVIVLMLGMAMPVFRYMTSSNSQAGALNTISSFLGRARNEAIGLSETRGVAFFFDPIEQRTKMALVHPITFGVAQANTFYPKGSYVKHPTVNAYYTNQADITSPSPWTTTGWTVIPTPLAPANFGGIANPQYCLWDTIPDTEYESMPVGTGAQMICNESTDGSGNPCDRFIQNGLIAFDAGGKLSVQKYCFFVNGLVGTASKASQTIAWNIVASNRDGFNGPNAPLHSQIGFVTYDRDEFNSKQFTPGDYIINTTAISSYSPAELQEEDWLAGYNSTTNTVIDNNVQRILINRFNGTLIKGE